jgi:two-component system sensor histidine kinase CreC
MLLKKNLRVKVKTDNDLLIKGDSFLLNQAVANLIQNAIDFSPENSQLKVITEMDDISLTLTIADEGPGIPDYALEKIFNKFFSLKRPDTDKKGTGLGLSFVKEVAGLHNGQVSVQNLAEGGAQAVFVIPILQ